MFSTTINRWQPTAYWALLSLRGQKEGFNMKQTFPQGFTLQNISQKPVEVDNKGNIRMYRR